MKIVNFSQWLICWNQLNRLIYVVWKPANEPWIKIDLKESAYVGHKSRWPHPHGLGAELLTVILTGSLWSARRWSCRNRKARVRVYCRERWLRPSRNVCEWDMVNTCERSPLPFSRLNLPYYILIKLMFDLNGTENICF